MTGQGGTFVYVVNPDRSASAQPVQIGRPVDDDVVVTAGIAAGAVVVTDGQLRLVPGARVEIKGDSAAGASVADPRPGRAGAAGAPSRTGAGPGRRPGGRP
jgi:multidrug efflux system membrane fusion protein